LQLSRGVEAGGALDLDVDAEVFAGVARGLLDLLDERIADEVRDEANRQFLLGSLAGLRRLDAADRDCRGRGHRDEQATDENQRSSHVWFLSGEMDPGRGPESEGPRPPTWLTAKTSMC